MLCKEAFCTVVPPSTTASNRAYRRKRAALARKPANRPPRKNRLLLLPEAYLYAQSPNAGALLVSPNRSRWAKESTFMTMPSVMYESVGPDFLRIYR